MSVIVKGPDEKITLICKGAESNVLGICSHGDRETTLNVVNEYAFVNIY